MPYHDTTVVQTSRLFASKKGEPTPRKAKKSKLPTEENQTEQEIDLESEEDNDEMPELHNPPDYSSDSDKSFDVAMDFEATKDSEDDETVIKEFATQDGINVFGTQDDADDDKTNESNDTEGAKFVLQLEQTQHSLDDVSETGQHWDKTRSDDLPNAKDKTKPTKPTHDRPTGDPSPNLEKDKESYHSDASQRIEKERKRAEDILDQETAACKLLFTPKVQHPK
jgi:hypothetical protein